MEPAVHQAGGMPCTVATLLLQGDCWLPECALFADEVDALTCETRHEGGGGGRESTGSCGTAISGAASEEVCAKLGGGDDGDTTQNAKNTEALMRSTDVLPRE